MQLTGGVWSATKKYKILSLLIGLFFSKLTVKSTIISMNYIVV